MLEKKSLAEEKNLLEDRIKSLIVKILVRFKVLTFASWIKNKQDVIAAIER